MNKNGMPHGIMFHHFHDFKKHIVSQGSLSALEFEKLLDFYSANHNILNADEWMEGALSGTLSSFDVCITFDDALKCQYDIAYKYLKKKNIKAFWFVYTSPIAGKIERLEIYRDFRFSRFKDIDKFYDEFFKLINSYEDIAEKLKNFNPSEYLSDYRFYTDNDRIFRYLRDVVLGEEKYFYFMDKMLDMHSYSVDDKCRELWMSGEDLKDMHADGQIIGLHSHTHHTNLAGLDYETQLYEYKKNKEILEDVINDEIFTASYPCSSYNGDTLKIMDKLGIRLAFRANMNPGYTSCLELPRNDHAYIMKQMKEKIN